MPYTLTLASGRNFQFKKYGLLVSCLILTVSVLSTTHAIEVNDNLLREFITNHQQQSTGTLRHHQHHATLPTIAENEENLDDSAPIELPPQMEEDKAANEEDKNPTNNETTNQLWQERNIYKALRHCEVEITQRIKGICKSMGPIGTACVSGDYMDVFNTDCM